MRVDRRTFVESLLLAPLMVSKPIARALADNVKVQSPSVDRVMALLMGNSLATGNDKAGLTLVKLAQIYRLTANSGDALDQNTKNRISKIIHDNGDQNVSAFADLNVLVQPAGPTDQAKQWADTIGTAMEGATSVVGPFLTPVGAAALGGIAFGVAPTLKYLATPGVDLSQSPLPQRTLLRWVMFMASHLRRS